MKIIALTPGDPEGVGPEITWKAIRAGRFTGSNVRILCVGAKEPFERLGATIIEATESLTPPGDPGAIWLLPTPVNAPVRKPKNSFSMPGYQSGWAIETATRLVLKKRAAALVTGPISKARLNAGGFAYPGHTEFLAKLCRAGEVTMMLANNRLRVSLVTTHVGIARVSTQLTRSKIKRAILHTYNHLKTTCGIHKPRIAVCGLNPHAGEGGMFGSEEKTKIEPEIRSIQRSLSGRAVVFGPVPADTFFAQHLASNLCDAVVCMYHDQGLIPVKLVDFARTINITLGLPILRTSVDHGVAFDIVGTGKADPSSLISAIDAAIQLTQEPVKDRS